MANPIIYIVDDDASVRQGLATLLDVSGYVVETFDCGEALLDWNPTGAGCILLDVRMPGLNGLEVQKKLLARRCSLPIIFLTAFSDVPQIVSAMKEGAEDFFIKPVDGELLVRRIDETIEKFSRHLGSEQAISNIYQKIEGLTSREYEILKFSIDGQSCKDVAEKIKLSHRTVELHRSHICTKIGVSNFAELQRNFSKLGIVLN